METTIFYYLIIGAVLVILFIELEWDRIKKTDPKKIIIVLILLFFLGSALSPFFT